ncbi:MAG: tetratricopeptide repeat protein [Candidatus Riflebacteria bacterium]|nr:tetratricopeptide repeat protein [Candidatus Riflebacteria bacterium]
MKTCPECGMQIPSDVAYCLYCGVKADTPYQAKHNRAAFFLIPGFIFFICLGLSLDLGSENFFEIGAALSSHVIIVYFLGALIYGAIKLFFRIPTVSGCFIKASLTSLINAFSSVLAAFAIESLFLTDFFDKLGPIDLIKYKYLLIIAVYLIVQLLESIAISLKAKVKKNPEIADTFSKQIVCNYLFLEIPIDFIIVIAICFYFIQPSEKIAFWSELMLNLGAKEKANNFINVGLEKYPENAKLCYLKSILLSEDENFSHSSNTKEVKNALAFAEKASQQKPNSPVYKFYLSQLLDMNKDYENAILVASQAADLADKDSFLWLNLGDMNMKYKKYSDSISSYKKSLTIDPDNDRALNNLSYTLLMNNQDYQIALELALKAVKLEPNSFAYRDTLAWAYYKCEKYTEALNEISKMYINTSEISPEIDFHYAAILDEMGLLNNPVETYDKMLVKPEIIINQDLKFQILEARNKADKKRKGK